MAWGQGAVGFSGGRLEIKTPFQFNPFHSMFYPMPYMQGWSNIPLILGRFKPS